MPQRVRRVGTASAAVSAGVLVLLLAAPASQAAAAEVCKKGVDPETTIENWKCNLGNMREALTPKTPTPAPKPTQSKTTKRATAPKSSVNRTPKAPAAKPRKPASAPVAPAPMTGSRVPQPYSENPPSTPGLPGVLPTPEIAADPNAYQDPQAHTVAGPRTRLISPVAASQQDDGRLLLVAAAAATAGAVGALNLSVTGRALRRRSALGVRR